MEGARKKKKKKKRKGDAIEEERKALKKKRIKYNILHQLYFSWASLVAQTVKNLPAVPETLGSIMPISWAFESPLQPPSQ